MKGITIQPQEKGVQNDKNGIKLEARLVIIGDANNTKSY
jgi:hypothetical protein